MRQLHGVLWTKGTLLTPQHLQVQDRYLQDLMHFKLSSTMFRPWGFQRLEVDREALAGSVFSLVTAAGIFPDGLAFEVPDADQAPAALSLEDLWDDPDRSSMMIHLSVPEHRVGAHNVAKGKGEKDARFFAEVILRRDENTGMAEKPIQVARKNLRLMEGGDEAEGAGVLPVARLVRSKTGEFELDPEYVPPLLDFTASDHLTTLARRLVEVIAARSSGLAGARRQRGAGLADFGVSDVASFWLLYTLNSHLPVFRHLFEVRKGHPGLLYEAMLRLAGALSTFSDEVLPGDLPTYDHQDLGGCFRELDDAVHRLLGTVIPQRHVSLPLKELKNSIHATALDEDRYLQATQAFLAVRSSADQAELIRKLPQLVKVSSGDRVERLIRQALPGVSVRHMPDPPSALPVKLDFIYFQLEQRGEDWDAVRRARNLAAYVPSDFPTAELELVLLLPRDESG
jgi:type VI secretion system protein ImpJ